MEVIDNVISAYEAVKMNGVSQGIIALCSFIAVIIVIQKFVTAWKEAFSAVSYTHLDVYKRQILGSAWQIPNTGR